MGERSIKFRSWGKILRLEKTQKHCGRERQAFMEKPRKMNKNIHKSRTPLKGNLIMKDKYFNTREGDQWRIIDSWQGSLYSRVN